MPLEPEQQKLINDLVEAIKGVLRNQVPEGTITDEPIEGIIIMLFPADHQETYEISNTMLGYVCINHSIELLKEVNEERAKGVRIPVE